MINGRIYKEWSGSFGIQSLSSSTSSLIAWTKSSSGISGSHLRTEGCAHRIRLHAQCASWTVRRRNHILPCAEIFIAMAFQYGSSPGQKRFFWDCPCNRRPDICGSAAGCGPSVPQSPGLMPHRKTDWMRSCYGHPEHCRIGFRQLRSIFSSSCWYTLCWAVCRFGYRTKYHESLSGSYKFSVSPTHLPVCNTAVPVLSDPHRSHRHIE